MVDAPAVPAREAAAVALVRDAGDPPSLEVLLLERHGETPFAPGAYVFPGGAVAAADRSPETLQRCGGRSDVEASALLGVERAGLAFYAAACRECFEECGVLLARPVPAADPAATIDPGWLALVRAELASAGGGRSFAEAIAGEGLELAAERLQYFSHWITPEGVARRYDSRFFLASMPAGQQPEPDGTEIVGMRWIRPAEALELAARDELSLMLPTMLQLSSIAPFATCRDALEAAQRRAAAGEVPTVRPTMLGTAQGRIRVRVDGVDYDAGPAPR